MGKYNNPESMYPTTQIKNWNSAREMKKHTITVEGFNTSFLNIGKTEAIAYLNNITNKFDICENVHY